MIKINIIRSAGMGEIGCLGEQVFDTAIKYRRLAYTTSIDVEEGLLIYNNLTDELILLNSDEIFEYENNDFSSYIYNYLVKRWFLVPLDHNDLKLCNEVNAFMRMYYDANLSSNVITEYVVFPTTDCNARCFYCYELGRSRINMSDQVASDVADYIIKSCKGHPISFRWFGGEPLYNLRAIDVICSKLKENNIVFNSRMISNGYLFDDKVINKATNLWNLKQVQISLDGTEEIYNHCKAFIYDDSSPFVRVTNNIKLLLEAGIVVKIRMNADYHNIENLYELTDFLFESFGAYKNVNVYTNLIFDETGNNKNRSSEEKAILQKKHNELKEYIKSKGFVTKYTLDNYLRYRQCMADNPSATTILPNGKLGKCEHFSDNEFWGSIYSEEKDDAVIERFKKVRVLPNYCDKCQIRPACIQLEMCPDLPKECSYSIRKSYIKNVENRILNTYVEYKTGTEQASDVWH